MIHKEIVLGKIDTAEAIRYMGYREGSPDRQLLDIIVRCEKELLQVMAPRYCYKVFDIVRTEDSVKLKNSSLVLKGESIRTHLKDCEKAVIMCATLSGEVDKIIRLGSIRGMTNALVLDALANAAIEQVCDEVESIIMTEFQNYHHTWRFGVGYGDFPLSTQKLLLDTIDAGKRIGVCATDSSILTPGKSVTCVIGLSKQKQEEKKSCSNCDMKDRCSFRQKGATCS